MRGEKGEGIAFDRVKGGVRGRRRCRARSLRSLRLLKVSLGENRRFGLNGCLQEEGKEGNVEERGDSEVREPNVEACRDRLDGFGDGEFGEVPDRARDEEASRARWRGAGR